MPPSSPRTPGSGVRTSLIAAIVVFSLGIAAGLTYIVQHGTTTRAGGEQPTLHTVTRTVGPGQSTPGTTGQSASSTTTSSVAPTPGAPSPTPTSEADALRQLNEWADADAARTPPDGKWQVVLGSKYVGIVDPQQQAAPFTAQDIWAQFQGYRRQFSAEADKFRVLRSSDYGNQQRFGGHVYWVAMLLFDFGSAAEAKGWCQDRFGKTGKALEEDCIQAHFTPPRG